VPLVKRVAASGRRPGLRLRRAIYVTGRPPPGVGGRIARGGLYPLERLRRACPDELLLLMPGGPASFDGRYFGVTKSRAVVGRARLLWAA
jgi:type IV secretory pathway protease TraF